MDYREKAKEVLAKLTLEEKASLCSGGDFWHTKAVERLNVPSVMLTDGPHGLRKQEGAADQLGINKSLPATCFPAACATACSYDVGLLREMGEAMGEECLQEDVGIILGPGANLKRSPLCGRNFEYFSEDPYLSGQMAAALIDGIQSAGVGASLKHYAANNQETKRLIVDVQVGERTLRELYLSGFEYAVKQAKPWTVMCSYNRVNGEYASQNKKLLTDILRGEWGFEGLVETDWGATVDRVKGLAAGCDLEMPFAGPYHDQDILKAAQDGSLPIETLDTAVLRILELAFHATEHARPDYRYHPAEHHALAREIAAQSAVLLKNDDLLPLGKDKKLAVLGGFAQAPRYQGAGSSRINPLKLDTLCGVLEERGIGFTYAQGYAGDAPDEALLTEAESFARDADVAIVCIGLPDEYESEGFDRAHINLPESHTALLRRAAKANPNTVVLLSCGGVVETSWLSDAKALLLLYLGGEAGAGAAADLLFGDATPCGKLAESWPLKLEDTPCYANFPGEDKTVRYEEGIFVGYRHYDTVGKDVRFPFGYGLSYTTFDYGGLTLEKMENGVLASVNIKNTGGAPGAEIVQFYVSQKNPSVPKASRELKAFSKVWLEPGEEKTAAVTLPHRAFAFYDVENGSFCVEQGEYVICAAASSRDIRCEASVSLDGQPPKGKDSPCQIDALPPVQEERGGGAFTTDTTLGEIASTQAGQTLIAQIRQTLGGVAGDAEDVGAMFEKMLADMPLRSLLLFSGGMLSPEQLQQIAAAAAMEVSAK